VDLTKKQDFKVIQNLFSQLLRFYPCSAEVRHYHTGVAYNVFVSMLRACLPEKNRNSLVTGCTFDGRLDTFYLVPDVATANQRFLARLKETLRCRYLNEKVFSL
jgi:hypothetical protein